MWPAVAAAALSAGGSMIANQQNIALSRENRRWQERMASTQAQRSVQDYAKAGLNPALAYDRPAAAPGSSAPQVEDSLSKGVSSGLSARTAQAQLVLMEEQAKKTQAETAATKFGAVANVWKTVAEARAIAQRTQFEAAVQPHQLRSAEIAKLMAEYGMTKAQAEQAYYKMMGPAAFAIDNLSGPIGGVASIGLQAARLFQSPKGRRH